MFNFSEREVIGCARVEDTRGRNKPGLASRAYASFSLASISGVSFHAHLTAAFSKQNCAASALPSKANICKKEKKLQAHVTDDSIDRLLP